MPARAHRCLVSATAPGTEGKNERVKRPEDLYSGLFEHVSRSVSQYWARGAGCDLQFSTR